MAARAFDEENCAISTSIEQRCATDDSGTLRCETLKRIYRLCPGRPPEEVSVERVEGDAAAAIPPPRLQGGLYSMFDGFHQMDAMFGAIFGGRSMLGVPGGERADRERGLPQPPPQHPWQQQAPSRERTRMPASRVEEI